MIVTQAATDRGWGVPARTSILVAAARAFGSHEPDESVRNPDLLAEKLIGPAELALIGDHPISKGLEQDYSEASQNPAIMGLAWLMLLRTRFIDEALERAVKSGATQIVVLGAGFDSRAYRFRDLLTSCKVFEVDAAPTQKYKMRRVQAVLGEVPHNLIYSCVDFAKDDLGHVLRAAGLRATEKTFYICEGVCMYLSEDVVRKTLQAVAAHSAPGSLLVLDYVTSLGIEYAKLNPNGPGGIPAAWGEPWIFGVSGANGSEFFRELGFDPGMPLAINNPDVIRRYTLRQDGTTYGASVFEKMRAAAQARAQTALSPASLDLQKAMAAAGGVYWLAELTVPE